MGDYWIVRKSNLFHGLIVLFSILIVSVLGLFVLAAHFQVLALLIVLLVFLICWRKPSYGFYLLLFVIPLGIAVPSFFRRHHLPIVDLVVLVILFCWFLRILIDRQKKFVRRPLDLPVVAFCLFLMLSLVQAFPELLGHFSQLGLRELSVDLYFVFTKGSEHLLYSLKVFFHVVEYLLLYFFVTNNISLKDKKVIDCICLSASVVLFLGLLFYFIPSVAGYFSSFLSLSSVHFGELIVRMMSTFDNPNVFSEYLVLLGPFFLGVIYWSKRFRYAASVLFVLTIICSYLTHSRGGWFGLMAGLIVFFFLKYKDTLGSRSTKKVLVVSLLVLILVLLPLSYLHLKERAVGKDLGGRVPIWQDSIVLLQENSVFGTGLGSFRREYASLIYPEEVLDQHHAHNVFLQIAVESGVFALAAFLWLLYALGMPFLTGKFDPLRIGLFSSVFGLLVHGLVDYVFFYHSITLIFFIYLGLLSHEKSKTHH